MIYLVAYTMYNTLYAINIDTVHIYIHIYTWSVTYRHLFHTHNAQSLYVCIGALDEIFFRWIQFRDRFQFRVTLQLFEQNGSRRRSLHTYIIT